MTQPDETASEANDSWLPPSSAEPSQEESGVVPPQAAPTPLRDQLRPALLSVPVLTLLTGVVFPLILATPARLLFPHQADGSLIVRDQVVVGSRLIGQADARPGDFHPRPSAAGDGYDATASGGTNLGPANHRLREDVRKLAEAYRQSNEMPGHAPIPIDAVTRSGSGLDPHISPSNAALQITRIARVRNLSEETVRRIVAAHTEGRQFGVLGSPRVSVLELNLALDQMTASSAPNPGR